MYIFWPQLLTSSEMLQTIVIWFSSPLAPLKLLLRSSMTHYYTFQWVLFRLQLTENFCYIWHFDSFLLLEILSSSVSETIALASKTITLHFFIFFNSFGVSFSSIHSLNIRVLFGLLPQSLVLLPHPTPLGRHQ